MALLTLSRAKEFVPNYPSADDSLGTNILSAVDNLIKKRLGRDIESTSLDEYYSGNGYTTMRLRQYPIISVQAIRWNYYPLLNIRYTDTTAHVATINVTASGLVLTSTKNASTTTTTLAFATYTTISALADAINAVSNWSAVYGSNYGGWATSDLKPQGVYDALRSVARIQSHVHYLGDFTIREECGEIYLPQGFARGINNYRIQATCGYASVPEAIVQLAAELFASVYNGRGMNTNLQSESLGSYSYTLAAEKAWNQLSIAAKETVRLYTAYDIVRYVG